MVTFDLTQSYFLEVKKLFWHHRWLLFHGLSGVFGFAMFLAALGVLLTPAATQGSQAISAESLPPASMQVYVSGAVQKPGVYILSSGQRLSDAISQAGGLSPGIDSQKLHTTLNLASRVEDGQHIHIPLLEETMLVRGVQVGHEQAASIPTATDETSQSSSQKISINTSSAEELMSLPQIGEKRAADIVAGRPYAAIDELLSKGIVTEKMYAAIKDLIRP